eukprot:4577595-Pyramimonas_sp.AAC.1
MPAAPLQAVAGAPCGARSGRGVCRIEAGTTCAQPHSGRSSLHCTTRAKYANEPGRNATSPNCAVLGAYLCVSGWGGDVMRAPKWGRREASLRGTLRAVSYTHLTLPTILLV